MKKTIMTACSALAVTAPLIGWAYVEPEGFAWPESETSEGVVRLVTSDTSANEDGSFEHGEHWSPQGVPEPGKAYWVGPGLTIKPPTGNNTYSSFAGGSLTVEGTLSFGMTAGTTIDHLRLMPDSTVVYSSQPLIISGCHVKIEGTREHPVSVDVARSSDARSSSSYGAWTGSIYGDSDSYVKYTFSTKKPAMPLRLGASNAELDLSTMYGTIRAECKSPDSCVYDPWVVLYPQMVLPGRLEIGDGVTLVKYSKTTTAVVNELSLESGSMVSNAWASDFLTVTGKLELAEGARYCARGYAQPTSTQYDKADYIFFSLSDEAAKAENLPPLENLVVSDLPDESTGFNFWGLDRYGYFAETNGSVSLAYKSGRPKHSLTQEAKAVNHSESGFTNVAYWADGRLPYGNENAVLGKNAVVPYPMGEYAFPAGGLVIADVTFSMNNSHFAVSNIFMTGASPTIRNSDYADSSGTKLHGNSTLRLKAEYLGVYGTKNYFSPYNGRLMIVDCPLYGNGGIFIQTASGGYQHGAVKFTSPNTNFTGRVTVSSLVNGKCPENLLCVSGLVVRVFMDDARNLGGAMATDTYDGLSVRSDAIICGEKSLTFDQPNRGVFVSGRARFVMLEENDDTLTIANPVTFGGEFLFGNDCPTVSKAYTGAGSGTLVLGGAAKFYDPGTRLVGETPVASSNKLTMVVGRLRPAATGALDGVAVKFGEESEGLELDWNASDELKATGFYSVKELSSLTSELPDGKIPVRVINVPADLNGQTIAVCTVPADVAEETLAKFTFDRAHTGRQRGAFFLGEEKDGQRTILLRLEIHGMMFIVR